MVDRPGRPNLNSPEELSCKATGGPAQDRRCLYSVPGVLEYIQGEWTEMEMERAKRVLEKAKLEARIALLQSERTEQERLLRKLENRMKSLQYTLRQERIQTQQFKCQGDLLSPGTENPDPELPVISNASESDDHIQLSRQLIQRYFKEIACYSAIVSATDLISLGNSREYFVDSRDSKSMNSVASANLIEKEAKVMNDLLHHYSTLRRSRKFSPKKDRRSLNAAANTNEDKLTDDLNNLRIPSEPEKSMA